MAGNISFIKDSHHVNRDVNKSRNHERSIVFFMGVTMKRTLITSIFLLSAAHLNAGDYSLEFIGEAQVESGFIFQETTVGGLSGIDYNKSTDSYVAISDDRAAPRFYDLTIDLSDGLLENGDVSFTRVTTILDVDDEPFTSFPDPEGIRVMPFPGLLFWTSERQSGDTTPFTRVMTTNGNYLAEFELPEKFVGVEGVSGTRNNVGFESITFSKSTTKLVVANESALVQDGARATVEAGSPTRVLVLSALNGKAKQEYIYNVDPIANPPVPADAFADSGLVELLQISRNNFIAMERSFSIGSGYTIKLYLTSTDGATDVSNSASIAGLDFEPMEKTLLLNLDELGITLDNVEGMTFGPKVDGQRTLVLVSDDNFSAFGPQVSQFLAFKIYE